MKQTVSRPIGAIVNACALALVLFSASCAGIRWISDYDEQTDISLTALQQKCDDFISTLETNHGKAAAKFESNEAFYQEIDRDLRKLEFRVASTPKNEHSQKIVADIRLVILGNPSGEGECSKDGTSLRDLHCLPENKIHGPSEKVLEPARRSINSTISAALQLELAKKQGAESNK